jgi:hypothetical protein
MRDLTPGEVFDAAHDLLARFPDRESEVRHAA